MVPGPVALAVENSTSVAGVLAEWGISVFIEAGEICFLLDTETTDIVVCNADRLAVDLKKAEALVLSQGHYDHTGGLPAVLQRICMPGLRIVAYREVLSKKILVQQEDAYLPLRRNPIPQGPAGVPRGAGGVRGVRGSGGGWITWLKISHQTAKIHECTGEI
jgi:glyoxylase-like metal-dependent hydrolase (beta-lactamase superfamily II)